LQLLRFENIIAIKTDQGPIVGFHAHNLHVAALDSQVWDILNASSPSEPQSKVSVAEEVKSEITAEIHAWNQERDPNVGDAKLTQAIRSLTINIAQICNLKCTYCAAGGDGTYGSPVKHIDLDTLFAQIRMLLSDLKENESFTFTFLGGEPLLYPKKILSIAQFIKLCLAGRHIKIRYEIVTNATLITPEIAELLASFNCHVTVSIDGPPEINDRQRPTRGGKGSTNQTLSGLSHLLNVRQRLGSLAAGSVFNHVNNDVISTYNFLRQFDFDSYKFDFAASANDSDASIEFSNNLLSLADLVWLEGGELALRKLSMFDHYFQILDGQQRIQNHCGAGKSLLQVDTSGKLTTCQWFVGDTSEEVGFDVHVNKEKLAAFAEPLVELNKCGRCWARHLCGGGCMYINKLKSGSKHQSDPAFCSRTQNIIAKGIEYYAQARYKIDQGV
jgi:uncharacterized protein